MVRSSLVVVIVLALCAPASADDFTQFVSDLSTNPTASAKRLAACDLLVTPNGTVRRPCTLALADLAGSEAGVTLKASKATFHAFPRNVYGWQDATVEVRAGKKLIATFHVVEVGSNDNPNGDFTVFAASWSRLVADKDALAMAKAGTLGKPPSIGDALPKAAADQGDRDNGIDQVRQALPATGDLKPAIGDWLAGGAVVFGSGPDQKLTGKSGAATWKSWKLDMVRHGGLSLGGAQFAAWGVTQLVGTTKDKSPVAITYLAFVVFTQHMTPGGGALVAEPALVAFSIPQ
jgi:hypothetical protein